MPTLPASKRGGKKAAAPSNVIAIPTLYAEAHRWVERLGRLLAVPVTNREEAAALHSVCDMGLAAVEAWGNARMILQALRTIRALRMMADAACEAAPVVRLPRRRGAR